MSTIFVFSAHIIPIGRWIFKNLPAQVEIFHNQDFGYLKITVERPLRLNFAVTPDRIEQVRESSYFQNLIISKKRKDIDKIREEIKVGMMAQDEIIRILKTLAPDYQNGELVKNRKDFEMILKKAFKNSGVSLDAAMKKALLSTTCLAEKDPTADPCVNPKGNPEPDPELRDTENVPFPGALLANGKRDMDNKLIKLPLPLDYETKKTKGKINKDKLLSLVKDHCEAFLTKEVLPYREDAWIDHAKTKVGYEIPFNRHFYQYEPPRPLEEIEADIKDLEKEIMDMLGEVV